MVNSSEYLASVKSFAKTLGFIALGLSRPARPPFFDRFMNWLSNRLNADMAWLERNTGVREDPSKLLEGCQTIMSLAYPYPSKRPATPEGFYVSRYSQPSEEDYHSRLRQRCLELVKIIEENHPEAMSRICIDSAPILERSLAYAAGIGFIGKNNMLIIPGYGSYFYLAEILTTAPLDLLAVVPAENQCGPCTRCMDMCPTGALEKAFSIDAAKCLSYLTVEYKGNIAGEHEKKMGRCFFGCDRCQEACPFNGEVVSSEISLPSTEEFMQMEDGAFKKRFAKTALGRVGLEKLKANIKAAAV